MTTITLSREVTKKNEDLVAIPRKEYEELLRLRAKRSPEVRITATQRKHIEEARKNIAKGNYLTLNELKQTLGLPR